MTFHPGIDLRAATGTPVYAARDGIVGETGTLAIYGYYIILNHDGGFQSVYAHLEKILVTKGTSVTAGTLIAESGNSGVSTGPHLHFEIRRNGIPTDPSRLTSIYD
jgi:murein DD-endopeptidase MepM/ murein hydrolase activator NlpD